MHETVSIAVQNSWAIPLFPVLSFLIIVFITLRQRMASALVSIFGVAASAIHSGAILLERIGAAHGAPYDHSYPWITIGNVNLQLGVVVDNLSAVMLFTVSFVGMLIQIYSVGYMEDEKDAQFSKYFSYMSLFTASMLGLVIANNLLQMYICWELVGLCSYLLIGFWYFKKSAADAAKKAFVVTRFGDLGFLIGVVALFTASGGLYNFADLTEWLVKASSDPSMTPLLIVLALLVFCGAIGKSAQFPLHVWLPDAMEGPTPVSALIHAATMVAAGVYLVARAYGIFHAAGNALIWVAYVGALTAFLAATMGVVQNDIKRVLAYSTVSQLGYMLLALGVGGYTAGTFHLITHAYFKALLFLCAGSVIHALHTNDMWEMGAVGRKMKITAWTFLIGCLALAGIPPFSGFFSKDEILAALWNVHGHPVLTFVGFAVVFLTAFYMFRAYFLTFCGKDRTHHAPHENRPVMTVPLIILAFFALTAGWVGTPWHNMFAQFIHFGASHHEGINYAPMALSLLLALGGILSAKALYGQGEEAPEKAMWSRFKTVHRVLVEKYYMDHFWEWVVEKIVFVASRIASFIDEMIVDGLVRLTGWATLKASDALRPEQTGRVQAYAFVIVFTVACVVFLIGLLEPNYVYGFLNAIMMRAQ